MKYSKYYDLLQTFREAQKDYINIKEAIENLRKIILEDKNQNVEITLTTDWHYVNEIFGETHMPVNAKKLLKYYESELLSRQQQYEIMRDRVNNTRLEDD